MVGGQCKPVVFPNLRLENDRPEVRAAAGADGCTLSVGACSCAAGGGGGGETGA